MDSIKITEINKDKCYFNIGCAFSIYKPHSNKKILDILNQNFGDIKLHEVCCQHNPKLPSGSTIINNCAGCDRRFLSEYEGISTISVWEMLDSIDNLKLPKYDNLTVSVHDSCSYRQRPQVHSAVRSLLSKMNIKIIESEFSCSKSVCCGDSFLGKKPLEEVHNFQKKRASQMPCQDVVVYCVSCIKSMTIGSKTAHHLLDLVLNEETEVQELDLIKYHESLQCYIDAH